MKIRPIVIVGIVVVLLVGWLWTGFNGLVSAKESLNASWAQVQTQYQRRADLIPNVVATAKGAANFEQSTLIGVTEARTQWLSAQSQPRGAQIAAAQGLDSAVARLLVSVESYPQLTATVQFGAVITELEGTENRISVARKDYNDTVRGYNILVKRFPSNVLAGLFGYSAEEMFQSAPGSDTAPKVDFGTSSSAQ